MDLITSSIAFLFLCGLAFFGLIRNPTVLRFVAHLSVTKEGLEKIRRKIGEGITDFDMGDMSPLDAEDEISERVRHIIGKTLAEINPRQAIEVTKTWPPEQNVIIIGDIAVIQPSIGILIFGPHGRIEPLNVRIKRKNILKLDNRRPIKDAVAEMYVPPPKATPAKTATKRAMPARRDAK